MFYFIFSGLSLLTLVIVCVAEPNVEEAIASDRGPRESGRASIETTGTREGKRKLRSEMYQLFDYYQNLPVQLLS